MHSILVISMSYLFILMLGLLPIFFFFFFNDTATTEIYTLSLHDALPICSCVGEDGLSVGCHDVSSATKCKEGQDRKSTRLNSSHDQISYAVFCLKKKKKKNYIIFKFHKHSLY